MVRFTGIHLMGRLAMTQMNALDEMFELFFEELEVLGRDPRLNAVIYRTVVALGTRSKMLNDLSVQLAQSFQLTPQEDTVKLGESLMEALTDEYLTFLTE